MPHAKLANRLGVYSRRGHVFAIDQRTTEGQIVRQVIRELTDQLGGPKKVTAAQKLIIHATAVMAFRMRAALGKYLNDPKDTESLDRHVVAIQNAMVRNLVVLGLEQAKEAAPTLQEYLAAKRAA